MSKKRKFLIITLIIILFFVLIIPLLLNVDFINKIVKTRIESEIANSINGKCTIYNINTHIASVSVDSIYLENNKFSLTVSKISGGVSLFALPFKKILFNYLKVENANIIIKKTEKQQNKKEASDKVKEPINFSYNYIFKNIPMTLEISSISLNNINFAIDTFNFGNLELNASLSINKKRTVLFFNLLNFKVLDYLSVNKSEGQIVLNENNGLVSGNINSHKLKIKYEMNIYDSTIDIRKVKIISNISNLRINDNLLSINGKFSLNGFYKINNTYMTLQSDVKKILFNNYKLENINGNIALHNDSIIINNLSVSDSSIDMNMWGITSIKDFPYSELNININALNLDKQTDFSYLDHHNLNGKLIFRINSFKNFTFIFDSINGYYCNDSFAISGSVSYNEKLFYAKQLSININRGIIHLAGNLGKNTGLMSVDFKKVPLKIFNYFNIPLYGEGDGQLFVKGGIDNYKIDYDISINNIIYNYINFDHVNIAGNIKKGNNSKIPNFLMMTKLIDGKIGSNNIKILYLELKKKDNNIYSDIDVLTDLGYIQYNGEYEIDNQLKHFSGLIRKLKIKTDIDEIYLMRPVYISLCKDTIDISDFDIMGDNLLLSGKFFMTNNNVDLHIVYEDDSLQFVKFFTDQNITGKLKSEFSYNGNISSPQININLNATNVNYEGMKVDSLILKSTLLENQLKITRGNIYSNKSIISIDGNVLINDFKDFNNDSFNLYVSINGIDSTYFALLFDIFTVNQMNLDQVYLFSKIKGSILNPVFDGECYINNVSVYILSLGTYIDSIYAYAKLSGNKADIINLHGTTERGKLILNGNVVLDHYYLKSYLFDIQATGAHVEGIDYIDAYGGCDMKVYGTIHRPKVIGDVFVDEAMSNLPFVNLSQDHIKSTGVDSSYIDLRIIANNNVWLKNNFVDAELSGNVRIFKDVSLLKITGKSEIIRGNYFYLDKKFTIDEGYFDLLESDRMIDPKININSHSKVNYYDIDGAKSATVYLNVSGDIDKPEISMYSNPPMGIDNIISILSFNTTVSGLNKFENVSKTLPEKALQMYLRSNAYLNKITSSMGVDQFNIETELLSEEKSAKLSVGKYIGNKLFVSYTHDLFSFSRDIFKVEYNFIRNAEFIAEKDEDGNFNTGFQFKFRY